MKNILTSVIFLLACSSLFSQIKYKIEVLPDGETYLLSVVSSQTYNAPLNKLASGQVTIRMPHGVGNNSFQVTDLTIETPGADWEAADVVKAPSEAPSFDYVSFSLITPGTDAYAFQAGVEIPVFSFKNGADFCADSIEIIRNEEDPFYPPNSLGANIGNVAVVLGAGFVNAYDGTIGTGVVPCTPGTLCTDETIMPLIGCESLDFQGQTITQDTVIDLHYTSAAGCDSVIITAISIEETLYNTVDTSLCEGDIFKGIEILQEQEIMETYISSNGCDSIVTYQVQLLQPSASESDLTVLSGQFVNGVQVFSDTTVISTLQNAVGCDSVATVHVTIFNVPTTIVDVELCLGEDHNGLFFMTDTSYVDTLVSDVGFDSLVVNNVLVFNTYYISNNVFICEGDIFNGTQYFTSTSYSEDLQTIHGCDSVITTNIHVLNPITMDVDTTICYGEPFLGEIFETDTVFSKSFLSSNGCDSLVIYTNLTVNPAIDAAISGVTDICTGEVTTLTASGGVGYVWSTGAITETIDVATGGDISVTVSDGKGCDEVATVTVEESSFSVATNIEHPLCFGDLTGAISIENIVGGFEPYIYSIDGGQFFSTESSFPNLSPGEYDLAVMDAFGCLWNEMIEIASPTQIWLTTSDGGEINLGESFNLRAFTNLANPDTVLWSPSENMDCPNCLESTVRPLETTTYRVTVQDENGCSAEAQLTIIVRSQYTVFVPNVFSPNGDGINDSFTVFAGDNVSQVRQFTVFERWGGHVFQSENIQPNDLMLGWQGDWRGSEAPEGTYVWMAEVEFIDGHTELFEGNVNLVR